MNYLIKVAFEVLFHEHFQNMVTSTVIMLLLRMFILRAQNVLYSEEKLN